MNSINSEQHKENNEKLRIIKQLRAHIHNLQNVNETIKLSIEKLNGVAYGKWPHAIKSRNKTKKWSKTRSKAIIKPTKMFILKLSSKANTKRSDKSKSIIKNGSQSTMRRWKNKSAIKYSRPIYERLKERNRRDEDIYQLSKARETGEGSLKSDRSNSSESLYSKERRKMASKSRILWIKTGHLNSSGSNLEQSVDDWIKWPTIEEDYVSSYGPKRKTKINLLAGQRKLAKICSEPTFDL